MPQEFLKHAISYYLVKDADLFSSTRVFNLRPAGRMQHRMAMNVAQHKIVNLLKALSDFFCVHVTMHLMCGPRQLFFFQYGSETPKVWISLRLSNEKMTTANTIAIRCQWVKIIPVFLSDRQKIYFLVCHRILVIILCVP